LPKEFGFEDEIARASRECGLLERRAEDRVRPYAELDKPFRRADRPGGAETRSPETVREYKIDACADIAAARFGPETIAAWKDLDVRERVARFEAFRSDLARELGIRDEGILWFESSESHGVYGFVRAGSGAVFLNRVLVEDANRLLDGVNTIAHESRHGFQAACMDGNIALLRGVDAADKTEALIAWWDARALYPDILDGAPTAGRYDPWGYACNALELDARHFADSVVLRIPRDPGIG
jgi:hypothetical protein